MDMSLGSICMGCGDQPLDHCDHLPNVLGAARLDIRRARQVPPYPHGTKRSCAVVNWEIGSPLCRTASIILSSMSVIFRTYLTARGHMFCEVNDRAGRKRRQRGHCRYAPDRNCRTADIHAYQCRIERFEKLFAAGQRVIKGERHGSLRRLMFFESM